MENKNILLAVLSGLLFGFWPIFMQRTQLSSYWQGAIFALFVTLLMLVPAAIEGTTSFGAANWKFAVIGGACGGFGMLFFTKMLTGSTPMELGSLFSIVLLVQVAQAAGYHVYMNGIPSLKKTIGFILTGVVVYLMK
jgi:uncharacterized membrane protein